MTPFERALHERIKAEGPITVEAYMEACNAYYYATRDPLGARGDFTTAPEISQMFGEMVGAALADCWTRAGAPADAVYAELGPGRGTLAADALRVLRAQASPARCISSRRARCCARPRAGRARRHWHDDDRGPAGAADAARCQRISRRTADPPACRRRRTEPHRRRRRPGVRSRRRDRRDFASPRDGGARQSPASRRTRRGRAARRLRPRAKRARATPSGGARASLCPVLDNPASRTSPPTSISRLSPNAARSAAQRYVGRRRRASGSRGSASRPAPNPCRAPTRTAPRRSHAAAAPHGPHQMGGLFKVMAIHAPDWPAPAGFA